MRHDTIPGAARGLALLLALPAAATAQQPRPAAADTFRLDSVVVTATRLATPLAQVPGTVTVITGEALRSRGIRLAADALRLVPGVAVVQSGGPGGITSVFMRGGESDYVQVLVDGVPANDPGGAFNWAHLRADDIERIEVVRGPASVLYGSDAVTGVVQIFTRAGGTPRVEAGASSQRGSRFESDDAFVTHAVDASVAGATSALPGRPRVDYGLNAGRLGSTGMYAFNSEYRNTNVSGRLQLRAAAGDVALTARHNDNRYNYPTTGSGAVVDPNQFATGRTWTLGADAGHRLAPALELRLQTTAHTFDSRTEDPADFAGDDTFWQTSEQTRRRVDARANWNVAGFIITGGADREWQRATTALESVSAWGVFEDASDHERTNTGAYVQLHGTPAAGTTLTLGGRLDENSAFGTFATGRAAASWTVVRALRLHAAAGTAFKEPTFFENYASGFTRGNPDLSPEESLSWEAGAAYALIDGRITLGGTWFDQRFRNLIQYTGTPIGENAPNYRNIGEATARGLELVAGFDASAALRLDAHYTLTRTRVSDDGFGSDMAFTQGERLLRRPEHQATLSGSWRALEALRLLVDVRHVGERDDLDFTDPVQWQGIRTTLDAYTTVDVAAEAGLRRGAAGVTATVRVRNLLDAEYVEIYNFPYPGRVVELGLRSRLPVR